MTEEPVEKDFYEENDERLNKLAKTMHDINVKAVKPEQHVKKHALTPKMIEQQWKPGQSGNPGGKVAGKSITAELRKLIDKGMNAEDMAMVLFELSKSKNARNQMAALKELLDRTDGKVPETHTIKSDVPVNIILELVERKDA